MPTKKSVQKRQKRAAGKARSIPVPGKIPEPSSSKKIQRKSVQPETAPLLTNVAQQPVGAVQSKTKPRIIKDHAIRHIRVLQTKGGAAAITVSKGYKKADAVAVRAAKKAVPASARERINENRAANNGNLQFYVPIAPKIISRKVKVVVPAKIRRMRHAALPIALVAVLVFTIFPAGAAPGYGGTNSIGGAGVDEARKVAVDSQGNTYTAGNFEGTVNFSEDWESEPADITLLEDDFDDGDISDWEQNGSVAAAMDQSVSNNYSLRAADEGASASRSTVLSTGLELSSNVYFGGTAESTAFYTVTTDEPPGDSKIMIYRLADDSSLCIAGTFDNTCSAPGILPDNSWLDIRVELRASGTSGFARAYVGGDLVAEITGDTGNYPFSRISVDNSATAAITYFDDVKVVKTEDPQDVRVSNSASQDIFITKTNADGSYGWTKRAGGSDQESVYDITVDDQDNVYVAGSFEGTMVFPRYEWRYDSWTSKVSAGDSDGFVAKIKPNGEADWMRRIGGSNSDAATGVAVDQFGMVNIGGWFSDLVTFDEDGGLANDMRSSLGGKDAFILQLGSSGEWQWTGQFGDSMDDVVTGLVVDSDDAIYAAGTFSGGVNFGTAWFVNDEHNSQGGSDVFMTKLSSAGEYVTTHTIGGPDHEIIKDITVDAADNVYLSGGFESANLNFASAWGDNDLKSAAGASDGFITKINANSTYGWTHAIGGTGVDVINTAGVDEGGNVYVGGSFTSASLDFRADWGGSDSKTNKGSADGFVTYLGAEGSYVWTTQLGDTGADAVNDIVVDADDVAHVVGSFSNTVDFAADFVGSNDKTSRGSVDAFIMKVSDITTSYKITDASGLTYEDENGVNLSSSGTNNTNPTVHVIDQDNEALLAVTSASLTEDRDWSTASGDSDLGVNKMFLSGVTNAPGAASTMTLYVPRETSDKAVILCPGADTLEDVAPTCTGAVTYTTNDAGVSTVELSGQHYWTIANVNNASIGGMSRAFPGVVLIETDGNTAITEEGLTDQVSVQLSAQPASDVTVNIVPNVGGRITTPTPLTFTAGNWDDPQLVLLSPIDNSTIASTNSFTLGYETASADPNYDDTSESNVITVDWTDNDTADVEWSGGNLTTESGATAEICTTLTAQPSDDVTLDLESADAGEVSLSEDSIMIAPEDWDASDNCVTATGVDDDEVDGPQDVAISVAGVTSDDTNFSSIDIEDLEAFTITNQDNDSASFTVTTSDPAETTELAGTAEICVELSARPSSGSVTIPLAVSDPSEASLAQGSLVIAAANWSANDNCVTITGEDDSIDDGDVAYTIQTGDPTAADPVWDELEPSDIADPTYVNIDNDTAAVAITESGGDTVAVEGGATDTISVLLQTQPADGNEVIITVQPSIQLNTGGGAGTSTSLTFTDENWDTPQVVTVSAHDDVNVEGDHSGSVTFSVHEDTTETPYLSLEPEVINVSITDNDIATATVTASDDTGEGSSDHGVFTVALDRQNNTGSAITFTYSIGGTAVGDTHYDALTGSIEIANGQSSAEIIVDAEDHNNNLFEGSKTVVVTLTASSSPSATIGGADSATVVIFDDETTVGSLSATQDGDEDGPVDITYTVTLTRANNTGAPVEFNISPNGGTASAGSDYVNFAGGVVTIVNGQSTGTLDVVVTDDALLEATTETVVANISNPSMSGVTVDTEADTASATIADNDTAEIGVTATDDTAAENPPSPGEFTISLDKPNNTGGAITVEYEVTGTATPDDDYDALSGEAMIPNGQSSVAIAVETDGHNDNNQEGNETVILSVLTTSLGGRVTVGDADSATVTVMDDEGANVVVTVIDDTTSETGETAEICFALTSEPSMDVTIALSSADTTKVTVPSSVTVMVADWDAEDNCVTATGQDDDPPQATGTQDVTIVTGEVTSGDAFYDDLEGNDVEDVTIRHADDDTVGIELQVVDDQTDESGDTALVQFRMTSRPTHDVIIPLALSDVTEGTLGGVTQIVLSPSDWDDYGANEITITGVDDYLTDGAISYQLVTGNPTSSDSAYDGLDANEVANPTLSNLDNDVAGVTIEATGGATNVTEGGATDTQTIQIATQPASGNQVVITATPENAQVDLGEGAGESVDVVFTSVNWQDAQAVTVTAVDDSLLESDHGLNIDYEINTSATTEPAYDAYDSDLLPSLNVEIADNDTATASLSSANGAEEGPDDLVYTVTLSKENNTGVSITVGFDPAGGTATVIGDYDDFTGTAIVIADGETTGSNVVGVVDDALLENGETVIGEISNPSLGAVTIEDATSSAIIADNDIAEVSIIADDAAATENPADGGSFTISLSKTNHTGSGITVNYTTTGSATADEDYDALSGSVTIANGAYEAFIEVLTDGYDDHLIEGNETVSLEIDATSHGRVSIGDPEGAAVTISDDDEPGVTVTASDGTTEVAEGGATDMQVITIDTQPAPGNEVVVLATPDDEQIDVGAGPGNPVTLTFANDNWDTPQALTAVADDDSLLESDHDSSIVYSIDNAATTEDAYDNYDLPTLAVLIADNDTATAAISAEDGSEEGPENMDVTITLSKVNNTGVPIEFILNPDGGTTRIVDDYQDFSGTILSVANGATTATYQVVVIDDNVLEDDETLQMTLSDSSLSAVTINTPSATATIADNDDTVVVVTATDANANENPSSGGVFTISLGRTNHSHAPITIEYTITGSATPGSDYAALPGTVSIPSGDYAVTVAVDTTGLNDDSVEGSETVILTLDEASHQRVSIGNPSQAIVTIIDDDAPSVTASASGGSTNVAEGGATDTQTIQIGTQPATGKKVVITATPANAQINLGGGAGNSVDRTFTDANWTDPQTITVSAVDDSLLESAHSSGVVYTMNLDDTDDPDYLNYEETLPTLTVNITDNDTATAALSATDGNETGPAPFTYTVTLDKTNNTGSSITFSLNPSGGTATLMNDYANFTGTTVSVPNGATTGSANIAVVDDSLLEGDETVGGTISNASLGAVTIGTASATATITDNDEANATIIATDPTATENPSSNGQFTVYLDRVNTTGGNITVSYSASGAASSGSDYAALSGWVVIGPGENTANIAVDTFGFNDDIVEGSETVIVALDGADHPLVDVGNPHDATVTIADDDGFTMNVSLVQDGNETGPESAVFAVELSHVNTTGSAITATVTDSGDGTALVGEDYESFDGTVSIPDGQQSTTFAVTIIDDNDLEGLENLEAVVSDPGEGEMGIASATATITDNDEANATIIATDPTATENPSSNGQFTLSLDKLNKRSAPIEFTYSVNGTATGGQDYTALSGNAMIAAGQSETTITVNTNGFNDEVHEGDETVIVTLTGSNIGVVNIGDPSQATITITDDDPVPKDPVAPEQESGVGGNSPRPVTPRPVTVIASPEAIIETPAETPVEQKPQPVDQTKKDLDKDGILDTEERKAHNRGDGNGDGIPDEKQENVSSLISPVTKKPVTLEVWGECTKVQKFAILPESTLQKQDKRYKYPYGLVDYALTCDKSGQEAHVTIYYDAQYKDIARWRKFGGGKQFAELQSLQTLAQPIGDRDVSTVQYSLRDGGANDDDGKADGKILDPAGPALRTFYFWDVGWILPVVVGGYFVGRSLHHRFRDHGLYQRMRR